MSRATAAAVVVDLATEADAASWDRFVVRHPSASGYHTWGWRRVFKNALGHESFYLVARLQKRIVGALPLVHIKSPIFGRSLTSLAFLNYGGVVADSDAAAAALITAAGDLARRTRCGHVELRHKSRQFPDMPCRQHKVAMVLKLQAGMWDRLDRKVRNQVRKAQKSELTAERGDHRLLNDFYEVFARNMRDLGTPVYSPRLFAEVLEAFPDRAALHIVRLGTKPIAAGLTYRTGRTVEVPWASSVREYNHLCPNHLLYWNIIETTIQSGGDVLDFGRSTPHEGTYRFKEQWGAESVPLHWEYVLINGGRLPNIRPTNPKFQLMIQAWKKLPLRVATALGPHVVRGIP
jgi:FemAB-related protein (PEP-CTERM system-associated)